MLPNGRQGQGAVVRRIALDGAETTWPGLLLLPGFPTENALSLADRGHNMRLRPKISNSFLNVHILFTIILSDSSIIIIYIFEKQKSPCHESRGGKSTTINRDLDRTTVQ
ncbi:MAG TPA: hypothetical protein DDY31_01095 [Lachnospiraceae bacterium]|nr:hypothetical protein [Lachnospiraceae bacterium]